MKHLQRYSIALLLMFTTLMGSAQVKPTIMVLPSDNWCTQRYYTQSFDNQGTVIKVPDYTRAFNEDTELPQAISKIGALLTEKGYSFKDAEIEIKNLNNRQAEDNVMTSKSSGSSIAETPLDILKRKVKADITVQLWWNVTPSTNGKVVSFTIEAFDSYTSKRIATSTGNSEPSNDIIPVVLENAVKSNLKGFVSQMKKWYNDMSANGREILLTVRCWDNWDKDLESEYNGEELTDCIKQWVRANTVNHSFNLSDGSDDFIQFEQVRIPLLDNNGEAMDAREFATKLRKYLAKPPYNITSKVVIRGLGEATLILGEK
jgi:hypothetical protein